MSFFGDKAVVPVVMFHSIGLKKTEWVYSHLSEPLDAFEEKIAALAQAGFHFIHWHELYEYMQGRRRLTLPAVMLTFDDGYLDNWVFAYPILKKYGAKGTIFVTPEFVDPREVVRPNLEEIWQGRRAEKDLEDFGFLSWPEMRVMEKERIMDIQSHALTHTWYFSSPKVVDFVGPGERRFPWLDWNSSPESKPYYMGASRKEPLLGTPVYEHRPALVCRRFFPPAEVAEGISTFLRNETDRKFFGQTVWKKQLQDRHDLLFRRYQSDCGVETEDQYRERVFQELLESRRTIEAQLEKEVRYISWPGGWYDGVVAALARQAGYKSWTLNSREKVRCRNLPHGNPEEIGRASCRERV